MLKLEHLSAWTVCFHCEIASGALAERSEAKGPRGYKEHRNKHDIGANGPCQNSAPKISSTTTTSSPSTATPAKAPKINELISAPTASTTATTPGPGEPSKSGTDDAESVNLGDGGTGGGGAAKNEKTAELLHEATQLLKTLRVPQSNPRLKVMQIGGLEHAEANMVLIDSDAAAHGLRPARDQDEWEQGERTTVQLANGTTDAFRLKRGTKILLGNPEHAASWIVPMGALAGLDFTMTWTGNQCQLQDDVGRQFQVQVQQGCPMVSLTDGQKLLQWLEGYQVHQWRKLAIMKNPEDVDPGKLDLEMALAIKLKRLFPNLPEEILGKLVPHLQAMNSENFGLMVPRDVD